MFIVGKAEAIDRLNEYRFEDDELRVLMEDLYRHNTYSTETVDAFERQAHVLSDRVCLRFATLQNVVTRHESVIRKRWIKKTVAERQNILLKAWPVMPKDHHPDSGDYCIPYVNLEDLSKPRPFLLFLNSRGRNIPFDFIFTEEYHCLRAMVMAECEHGDLCDRNILRIKKTCDPLLYAKLQRDGVLDRHGPEPKDERWMCPRFGLLVLHMQGSILFSLLHCCRLILHELSVAEIMDHPIEEEQAWSDLDNGDSASYQSLSEVLLKAPYHGKHNLFAGKLQSYVNAALTTQKDHLWALREDPSYFADTLKAYEDHLPLQECHIQLKPSGPNRTQLYQDCILSTVVDEAYTFFIGWSQLDLDLSHFSQLSGQGAEMSQLYHVIVKVKTTAFFMLVLCITRMRRAWLMSPPLSNVLVNKRYDFKMGSSWFKTKANTSKDFRDLLCIFDTLLDISERLRTSSFSIPCLMILTWCVEEMESAIQRNPHVKRLLSEQVLSLFSMTSVLVECLRQVFLWAALPEVQCHGCNENCPPGTKTTQLLESAPNYVSVLKNYMPPIDRVYPYRQKLYYPVHKRHDQRTTLAKRKAEENLDAFWHDTDQHLKDATGFAHHPLLQACLEQGRDLKRTEPWVEQAPRGEQASGTIEPAFQPLAPELHDPATEITGAFDKSLVLQKPKAKTRAVPGPLPHTAMPEPDLPDQAKPTYTVDKRSYKVFKTLFHTGQEESGDLGRVVKWQEFERAMSKLGFSVIKLQGSAWQFTPGAAMDITRGIQFHEPHPSSDMPLVLARRYGRRLGRVYGRNCDTFKLS